MKTKILGGYSFQSKNGKNLTNLTCVDERQNADGVCAINLMAMTDSLPVPVKDMINKNYLIDVRYGQNGSMFAQNFYEVK